MRKRQKDCKMLRFLLRMRCKRIVDADRLRDKLIPLVRLDLEPGANDMAETGPR